jgi:hypothetical protein
LGRRLEVDHAAVFGQLPGARPGVHIHVHGVTAEDVVEIRADVNRPGRWSVL